MTDEKTIQKRDEVNWFNDVSTSYRKEYDRETTDGFSFRMRRDKVLSLIPQDGKGKKVLDIACGPGILIPGLRERGYTITAVDAAQAMVDRAREEHKAGPDLTIEVGDVYALKYPDATFDAVTALGLVEYLDDQSKAHKEMARVLKPGGTLVVSYPYRWSPWRIWGRFLMAITWIPRRLYKLLTGSRGHYITHREYTVADARAKFSDAGVTPDRVWFYNLKLVPWPLDQWFPRFTVWQSSLLEGFDSTPFRWIGTAFNLRGTKR
jgi:ubiquinone/menaquinone biosynthesis C-methylase UbiE